MRALGTSCIVVQVVVAPLSRQKMGFSLDTWNNAKIHSDQSETYIKSTYTLGHRIFRDFNARRMRDCNHLLKSADFKQKFESSGSLSYKRMVEF